MIELIKKYHLLVILFLVFFFTGLNSSVVFAQKSDSEILLEFCLDGNLDSASKLTETGTSLYGMLDASRHLYSILIKHAETYVQQINDQVVGFTNTQGQNREQDLHVFECLLIAGANPDFFRILGFEKPGREKLSSTVSKVSSGKPGYIARSYMAKLDGITALAYTEINEMYEFQSLILETENIRELNKERVQKDKKSQDRVQVEPNAVRISEADIKKFMSASREGRLNDLDTLISLGIDINIQDRLGKTALIHAVQEKRVEVVKFLIEKGANANIEDSRGVTALGRILFPRSEALIEIQDILVKAGARR